MRGSIRYDELVALYNAIYPSQNVKLNTEDWILCDIAIMNNLSSKVQKQFEIIHNRIDINKSSSLQLSEVFIENLVNELQPFQKDIYGIIEPFGDKEQRGLMLKIVNKNDDDMMFLWSYENSNHDLEIAISNEKDENNLFIYDNSKIQSFSKTNLDESLNFCVEQIKIFVDKSMNINI